MCFFKKKNKKVEKKEEKPVEVKKAETKKVEAKPAAKKAEPKAEAKPAAKKAAPKAEEKKDAKRVYHVAKREEDGMWQVKYAGGEKAIKLFKTKAEAEAYTKQMAENQGGAMLMHNSKGANKGKIAKK